MRKADNLPPSCAVVTKSGNLNFLEPSGSVQACNGTALPFLNALISQIYFWNKPRHVSDSSSLRHQEFFTLHTAMVYVIQVCWQLESCVYSEKLLMMDIETLRNMWSFIPKINLRNWCISWFYYKNLSRCTVTWKSNLLWVCFSTSCAENCVTQPVFIDQSRKGAETFGADTRACYILIKSSSQNLARTVTSFKACFIILWAICLHAFF